MKTTAEEIIESISIDRSNLEYIAVTGKINGSLYISIKNAMESYANQFKYDYSKTCKCGDDATGETWCCDTCGLPTVKHSKKNRPQQIIDKRRVWLAENSIEDWNDFDTNMCMQIYSNQENKELFDKLKTVSASLKEYKKQTIDSFMEQYFTTPESLEEIAKRITVNNDAIYLTISGKLIKLPITPKQ